jgi:hypothetical protein
MNSLAGRVLAQAQMSLVLVVVANVLAEESFEVAFIQGNNMIQQISAAALHPALGGAILPRTLE